MMTTQDSARQTRKRADGRAPATGRARSRRLLGLVTASLIGLSGGLAEASPPQPAGTVYTADEFGNSISAVDIRAGRVTTVPVSVSPHNVQVTADGARLLAVGDPIAEGQGHGNDDAAHGAGPANGRLIVLDPSDLDRGPLAEIEVGRHPAHVIADPSGRRAFVTSAGDNAVTVIDLANTEVVATVGTGRFPHGLRMSPDGKTIYVANAEDGSLSVIDAENLVEVARVPVGKAPVQVGFTPDGSRVYASLRDENRVAVVDTATRALIGTIEVGRNPIQVHVTPDGRYVYVANQGTTADPADTVSVIDAAAGRVVDTIRTGLGAHGVAVSDDGAFAFITNIVDGTLSMIDVATRKVVAAFPVGQGPNGVSYRRQED